MYVKFGRGLKSVSRLSYLCAMYGRSSMRPGTGMLRHKSPWTYEPRTITARPSQTESPPEAARKPMKDRRPGPLTLRRGVYRHLVAPTDREGRPA